MTEAAPPVEVNNIYEYDVYPGLGGTGGDLAGTGNGGTVTAIGSMGPNGNITYTSVLPNSTATINGTYLNFSVNSALNGGFNGTPDNTAGNSPIPNDQAVIDAIQANENNATPISDTFYYQVTNATGTTTDSVQLNLEDVEEQGNGAPFTTPATVGIASTTNIGGFTFDKPLATGQAAGADQTETLSVTLSLTNNSGSEGSLFIDQSEVGLYANTGETVSFGDEAVTITGQIQAINSDLQGLSYIAPSAPGSDGFLAHATDGPAETPTNYVGNIETEMSTITGTPVPVDNSYSTAFGVEPAPFSGIGTGLAGYNSGDTIISVSSDDINFTPVDPNGSATANGTYVSFTVDNSDGGEGISVIQDNQTLIDDVQANTDSGATTPLSDIFYYQLVNPDGSTVTDAITVQLNDFHIATSGAPYTAAATIEPDTALAIPGLTVDNYLTTEQINDGGTDGTESLVITLSALDFTLQHGEGSFSIDPSTASDATVMINGGSITIAGSIDAINQDLAGLTFTSGDQGGQDYLILDATDGPSQVNGAIIGVVDVECFLTGTRIRTPHGDVPVESLCAGDLVATLHSGPQPIKAIQHLGFTSAAQLRSAHIRPIRIATGALAPNTPSRDLYVSPDHAMFLDGALVPAKLLINGTSITQPPRHTAIGYIHIELAPHGIIFAENAATETYLDIGKSTAAHNLTSLDPFEPKSWEDACAPLLLAGPALTAIRTHLANRAAKFFSHQRKLPKAA